VSNCVSLKIKELKGKGKFHNSLHKLCNLPLQDPTKFTQIAIFGLKIDHMATLVYRNKCFPALRKGLGV
jgi:hypothetical protein